MNSARIMVVEDEIIVADDIAQGLQEAGYEIAAMATSARQAVAMAREHHPDLILMDIVLEGDLDGIEAARLIRAESDIPVVYLTAYADEAVLDRARDTEPFGYLLKPFRDRELCSTIEMALFKSGMQRRLREATTELRILADFAYDWEEWHNPDGTARYVSPSCRRITGYGREEFLTDPGLLPRIVDPEDREEVIAHLDCFRRSSEIGVIEFRIISATGDKKWLSRIDQPVYSDQGEFLGRRASTRDITRRKAAEVELESQNAELRAALDQVRALRGLLPICASCKRIRKDNGYWQQIESFIREHSEAEFTHGLCPECAKKLYPDCFED